MVTELTWSKAIQKVLGSSPAPLHYNEITERIIAEGYRKSIGATPSATVNAHIASSIKHDGDSSPYIRTSKRVFALRGDSGGAVVIPKLTPEIKESEEEEQYDIVTSFGMFWRKDAVEWIATDWSHTG